MYLSELISKLQEIPNPEAVKVFLPAQDGGFYDAKSVAKTKMFLNVNREESWMGPHDNYDPDDYGEPDYVCTSQSVDGIFMSLAKDTLECQHVLVDDDPGDPEVGPHPNVYCKECGWSPCQ